MADLLVTVGADASAFQKGMQDVGNTAKQAASNVNSSMNDAAMGVNQLGRSAQSASMQFQQMRSGLSAARDGTLAFAVGGQRADMMLMAMGHHITSLVNETGSLGGAFKSLGQSLLGIGGIILAITLAFEIYEKSTKKSKDAIKEAQEAEEEYLNSLGSVRTAILKGQQDGQGEITRLQILYRATQDHTLSLKDRNLAYDALETKYPILFTNAEREQTLLGENATMYNKLAASILSAAAAKAYENQIGTNSNRIFENQQKGADQIKIQKDNQGAMDKDIAAVKKTVPGLPDNEVLTLYGDRWIQYKKNIEDAKKAVEDLNTDTKKLNDQNAKLSTMAMGSEEKAGFSQDPGTAKDKTKEAQTQFELLEQKADDLKLKLENAFLANSKPTIISEISEQLASVSTQIDKVKKQLEDYLLISRGNELLESANPTGSFKKNNKAVGGTEINGVSIADTGQFGTTDTTKTIANMQAEVKLFSETAALRRKSISDQTEYNTELKEEQKIGQDLIKTFGGGLSNAFQSALSGTQNFVTAMAKFLEGLIEKLVAAAAAAAVLSVLLDATGFGAVLGLTTAQTSFTGLFGQLAGIGGIGKHASGGIFTQAHVGMFGEAGPEAIVTPKHLQDFAGIDNTGRGSNFKVEHKIQGSDMLLLITRANKSKGRTS